MVSITMSRLIFLVSTMLPFETNDLPQEDEEDIDPFAELEIGTKSAHQGNNNALAAFEEDDDPLSAFADENDNEIDEIVISFEDDDVPEIEPDVTGATTLREKLIMHREDASCAQCHKKIDPAGFALENFDAIGAWREKYNKSLEVDSSGKLPNGKTFSSPSEFKKLVIEEKTTFVRCLTKKLLTYAIGRKLNSGDRDTVDSIVEEMNDSGKGMRDLIKMIVLSETFLSN